MWARVRLWCTRNEDGARLNVMLNGEALEVDQFKYLGSVIAANDEWKQMCVRVNEGCKVLGALKGVMKNRGLGMNVKKVLVLLRKLPIIQTGQHNVFLGIIFYYKTFFILWRFWRKCIV